jgi:hypothetical protein
LDLQLSDREYSRDFLVKITTVSEINPPGIHAYLEKYNL